ncbi:MAG: response regulator [bacterium]|nr:response regulator [bacterium]
MEEISNQKGFSSQSDSKENSNNQEKETILIIDDELGPRESLRFIFKDKYNVITAESGSKGIEIVKSRKVDIIILDLKMPDKNGIETLEEIRKYDENVPIIILTGYGDMEAARKAMHYGVIEFLSKPFEVLEIERIVAKGIEKGKTVRESERLIKEINSLRTSLLQRIEEIEHLAVLGQMSSEIIHEINNLLTVIHGYTQLLMEEVNSKQLTTKYISIIENEIKRCKNIAKNIFQLIKEKNEIEKVNINQQIENLIEFLNESKLCKDVKINIFLSSDPLIVKCNPNNLYQAFLNIILNSLQAIGKEGEIYIETSKTQNEAIIKIKDTGKGIPQNLIEKIKEPFFTTKEEGVGIGLHLTYKIIKKYGGRFEIKSELEKGTEFIIFLPLSLI